VILITLSLIGILAILPLKIGAYSISFNIKEYSWTYTSQSVPENFTIVVLPDSQHYPEKYPWIFDNQTEWIVENIEPLNIVIVSHL
jgi:hypothetical protein